MPRGHPDWLVTAGKTAAGEERVSWEYLIDNGDRIIEGGIAEFSLNTLYTVPAGKKLYVIFANLSADTTADVSGSAGFKLAGENILTLQLNGDEKNGAININATIPILLDAGEKVEVYSTANNIYAVGNFIGYLVDV